MSNLINSLPPQWSGDLLEQNSYIESLKTYLQNALLTFDSKKAFTVLLSQTTEPTQGQWEGAYTSQTGLSLPISSQTVLIWWNSNSNTFGGLYGTTPINTTVYPRFGQNTRNTVQLAQSQTLTATISDSHPILNNLSRYPVLSVTTKQPLNLDISYVCYLASHSGGGGSYGADVLMNGVKLGTSLYGLASNRAPVELASAGMLFLRLFVPNLAAGTYTFQVTAGYTGTPVTVPTVGSSFRQFIIKGVGV